MTGALVKLICLVVACMAVLGPKTADAAIACNTVVETLTPCIGYLRGAAALSPPCCGGVQRLNGLASSTPDRQAACRCLQNAARNIPGISPNLAAGLPGACRVRIPYPISLNTNCNNVK